MNEKLNIAIVGATGMVGATIIEILEQRQFPIANLYPLASSNSAGKTVTFQGQDLAMTALEDFDFAKVDIALFSAGRDVSREYAPKAAQKDCIVIDNTSEFRYDADIPLVVPEVNPEAIANFSNSNIIANPNCSVIQAVVALAPIYKEVGIAKLNIATYQAVSGTGNKAVEELSSQVAAIMNNRTVDCKVYPKQIAFNVLPHVDSLEENGYTREEMKMVWEIPKIMADPEIEVNVTATRVPVFFGHSLAVHITTKAPITAKKAKQLLGTAAGVVVVDNHDPFEYPTPVEQAASEVDAVYVGRIRGDLFNDNALNIWVVADNVRKGGALNSVQIAEVLLQKYL